MTAPDLPPKSSQGSIEAHYGFPAPLWRALERHRPPGMGLLQRWRSPLRGPWLTSVFGFLLLISLPLVALTGLLVLFWFAHFLYKRKIFIRL